MTIIYYYRGEEVEKIISVNGVELWTSIQGEGIPLVLCHGGPGGYDYLGKVETF